MYVPVPKPDPYNRFIKGASNIIVFQKSKPDTHCHIVCAQNFPSSKPDQLEAYPVVGSGLYCWSVGEISREHAQSVQIALDRISFFFASVAGSTNLLKLALRLAS